MDGEGGEFPDWEVLQQSDDSGFDSTDQVHNSNNDFQEIDDAHHSEGMIQTDYFSLDRPRDNKSNSTSRCISEVGSENSDNPSWIEPNSDTIRYPRKDSGESWSDSGSDRSDCRKFNELEGENEKLQVDFQGIEEMRGVKMKTTFEVGSCDANVEGLEEEEKKCEKESVEGVEMVERKGETKAEEEEKKKSVVWWKVPIEFLRYCVFRASPGWTSSVAAAVMGFVTLGRRLYKMKKKNRGLELKVSMDDKAFFVVIDGHGGRAAADFVAEHLGRNILNEMKLTGDHVGNQIEAAIRRSYSVTDAQFLKERVNGGACAASILLKDGELHVANVGGCKAILSRNGVANALTTDQCLTREHERTRIENSGGFLDCHHSVSRVNGSLAVSSAFAELNLKDHVISEPDILQIPLTSECKFLIMASDGLWDQVGNQEAVDVVSRTKDSLEACKELVAMSTSRGGVDDVTVMVINLQNFVN